MGDDLAYMSAVSLAASIRSRAVSPVEVLEQSLARVDALDPAVNAVVWRNDDEARSQARAAADAVLRSDAGDLPPFFGVPIPIKDLTPVAGWPLTLGSSGESALVVDAFRRAGFVLTGRTNTPEFGSITVTENLRYGVTRNPWDLDRTCGGSSGGAAAAVAAGMFSVAHASDGGGSIRIPASCCGLVGLKPSRGRVPRAVMSWEGGSVDGVEAHDVTDAAAVLDAICGPDRGQWYNAPAPPRPFAAEVGADPGRLRVGLVDSAPLGLPMDQACAGAAREAAAALEKLGHEVEPAQFEVSPEFYPAFMKVIAGGLADMDVDWDMVEPHNQVTRQHATTVDSLSYVHHVGELQRFSRRLAARWGSEFDVLVTPTMTIEPPAAGEVLNAVHEGASSGVPVRQLLQMAVFTSAFNMSGQPAISLPTHTGTGGIPVGVQLVGGPFDESGLLRVASQLEQALPWADRRPSLRKA
jgi:amidase